MRNKYTYGQLKDMFETSDLDELKCYLSEYMFHDDCIPEKWEKDVYTQDDGDVQAENLDRLLSELDPKELFTLRTGIRSDYIKYEEQASE